MMLLVVSQKCRHFSQTCSNYTFFGHSIRRWDILTSFTGESEVTLKRLNPTRWSGRLTSLMGVKHRYPDVLKALTRIILMQHNKDERDEASRLKECIERLEFVFCWS